MVSVAEYAQWRGISPQRVRRLLRSAALPGHRVGARQWEVADAAFGARPRLGPGMSPAMAWALIALIGGDEPEADLPPVRRDRLGKSLERLFVAGSGAPALLSSWLRHRGDRLRFRADANDVLDLLADPRVMPSGVSDPRSGMSAADMAEVWVRNSSQLDELIGDYLLLPDENGNVVIHLGREQRRQPASLGLVIADLADWNGPREDGRVVELLAERR